MGFSLILSRETNINSITPVVMSMLDDLGEDKLDPSGWLNSVNVLQDCWLKVETVDHHLVGYIHLKPFTQTVLEIHPYLLKSMRKYSYKTADSFLNWFNVECPKQYHSLYTKTPSYNRKVALFLLKMGFFKSSELKAVFYKNNRLWDLHQYQLFKGVS